MATVPVDLLGSLAIIVAVNSEPGVAVVCEVTVIIDTEASGVSTLRYGSGVRSGQADRLNLVFDNIQALEASRSLGLGGERNGAVVTATTHCQDGRVRK